MSRFPLLPPLFNLFPNDMLQLLELDQVNLWMGVGMMSLRWHCITQLSCPLRAAMGTLGPQDWPDFTVEQIPLTVISSMMGRAEEATGLSSHTQSRESQHNSCVQTGAVPSEHEHHFYVPDIGLWLLKHFNHLILHKVNIFSTVCLKWWIIAVFLNRFLNTEPEGEV